MGSPEGPVLKGLSMFVKRARAKLSISIKNFIISQL
jgi:hypothetical protein